MMGCFWCCFNQKRINRKKDIRDFKESRQDSFPGFSRGNDSFRRSYINDEIAKYGKREISSQFFTYEELSAATKNFSYNFLIGEGGFGRVYKGKIANKTTAQPLFKDRRKFHLMADSSLEGRYPMKGLYQALAVAAMCLQEDATKRPVMSQVVSALEYLASGQNEEQQTESGDSSCETD
ncbi:hypothetical protein L2E82_37752 [Cichorium intybus]|uniref:Uncharacterized protein n=1 Tax=Cichorium intybus TaxID=13427 RepID=A0ACB9AFW1_CICIN|nr:hypothetical protein L2E82_37752 [Cichorium intybus]